HLGHRAERVVRIRGRHDEPGYRADEQPRDHVRDDRGHTHGATEPANHEGGYHEEAECLQEARTRELHQPPPAEGANFPGARISALLPSAEGTGQAAPPSPPVGPPPYTCLPPRGFQPERTIP